MTDAGGRSRLRSKHQAHRQEAEARVQQAKIRSMAFQIAIEGVCANYSGKAAQWWYSNDPDRLALYQANEVKLIIEHHRFMIAMENLGIFLNRHVQGADSRSRDQNKHLGRLLLEHALERKINPADLKDPVKKVALIEEALDRIHAKRREVGEAAEAV